MLSPLRGLVALGLLAATLVGLGGESANASHTPDGQPTDRDFVTGEHGEQPDGNMQLITSFNASSGPSGQNPTGTVVLGLDVGGAPDPTIAGYNVTCLKVSGNRATIGGVLDFNNGPPFILPNAIYYVEDGVGGAPDGAAFEAAVSSPPTTCPDPLPAGHPALRPSVGRDLTVHDAVELPSNPQQCFGGGWQRYGFENLGKCLAFVFKARLCELLEERLGHLPKFCPPTPPRST